MVLAYHEITSDPSRYRYSVTAQAFSEHLEPIKSFCDSAPGQMCVTFDDGHKSQFEKALPLLEASRVPGIFFVTAGWTNTQADYMTGAQLRELTALGHRVQAHSWSHEMLTLCSPSELYDELRQPKQWLEDLLGCEVDAISVPHGRWNAQVLNACRLAGYKDVYISEAYSRKAQEDGVRLIGRLMVTHRSSARSVAQALQRRKQTVDVYQAKDMVKNAARSLLGERRYHALWRSLAAQKRSKAKTGSLPRPLRILHLISSNGFYGAEAVVLNLARHLEKSGCHSTIAVFKNSRNPHTELADRAKQHGIGAEVVVCRNRLDRQAVRSIRRIICDSGVDVVHCHGFKSDLYGAAAARPLRIPLISTHHSNWPHTGAMLRAYNLVDRLTLRAFGKVIAVSDEIARSLRSSGITPEKLETIPNGIEVEPFRAAATARQTTEPSAGKTVKTISLVARLIESKGHRVLLQAAAEVLQQHPDVIFRFVGEGPDQAALAEMVTSLGLNDRVSFSGFQSDMPSVYAFSDLIVLPSATEGTPISLLEAMAAGVPVIATRVGGIPKLIRDGATGLLIEPGDATGLAVAINGLLSDETLRRTLAEQGQRHVCEQFSAQRMAEAYLRSYELLSSR